MDAEATLAFIEAFSQLRGREDGGRGDGNRDFSPDTAEMKSDLHKASPPRDGKSLDGKRQRRLKKTAVEADSVTSKKLKISLADVNDDTSIGEMQATSTAADEEDCVICMCPMTRPKKLSCGHAFCADCIDESFKRCQPKCPSCGRLFGVMKGNQPLGTMNVQSVPDSLAGFERCGTLLITYSIPSGMQNVSPVLKLQTLVLCNNVQIMLDATGIMRIC